MADTLDIQHGLLSYANPNYNLASPDVHSANSNEHTDEDEDDDEEDRLLGQALDDEALGENDPYQALYEELDAVCRFGRPGSGSIPHSNTTPGGVMGLGLDGMGIGCVVPGKGKTRRSYAQLDINSMGVDVEDGGSLLTSSLTTSSVGAIPVSPYQSLVSTDSENNIGSTQTERSRKLSLEERNNNRGFDNSRTRVQSRPKKKDGTEESARRSSNSLLDYYSSLERAASTRSGKETDSSVMETEDDPAGSHGDAEDKESSEVKSQEDSAIPHIQGELTNELYAVPVKRRIRKSPDGASSSPRSSRGGSPTTSDSSHKESIDVSDLIKAEEQKQEELLPPGWERHEDDDGPYYWHISSGTIQREPPAVCPSHKLQSKRLSRDLDVICNFTNFATTSSSSSKSSVSSTSSSNSGKGESALGASSTHSSSPKQPAGEVQLRSLSEHCRQKEEMQLKRRSYPQGMCSLTADKKPIRFAVRSLGWVEIAEEDLTPERSSKAVNRCIVDLSLGRNDILDVVGRWGDGKDLFMDLDDYSLRLIDPQDFTVLNTQPIHTIRVWGVGRDNGRDFAYVARDRLSRKHMCHVFRCDNPARIIANTLRDICKKIMIERSLQQNLAKQVMPGGSAVPRSVTGPLGASRREALLSQPHVCRGSGLGATRPNNLPTEQRRLSQGSGKSGYSSKSFPTPMEEPKKLLKAYYLGSTKVDKPTGMDTLNLAIDRLTTSTPKSEHKYVHVAVAPSTITILEPGEETKVIAECRVRFLSFLGIGRNVKTCAFIVHTAHDQYVAHVFTCEPSSGALCKTIEAACKLRYQKCLDAHRLIQERKRNEAQQNKGLTSTIRNVLGNLTTRLTNKSVET